MSLFEWWGESRNPGPMGTLRTRGQLPDETPPPPRFWHWVALVIGQGVFWYLMAQIGSIFMDGDWENGLLLLGLFGLYLFLAHYLLPEPRTDNLGWLGGAIDHPFRISDDWNRTLVFLQVLLLPGQCMTFSWRVVAHIYRYLRRPRP